MVLSPFIKLYLEILMTQNEISKIKKIIKKYWNDQPSSSLRIIILNFLKIIIWQSRQYKIYYKE